MHLSFLLVGTLCCTLLHPSSFTEASDSKGHYIRLAGDQGLFLRANTVLAASDENFLVLDSERGISTDVPGFKFFFDGPFIYADNKWGDYKMCLNTLKISDYTEVGTYPCSWYEAYRWFLKVHPNQEKGPNGQLLFSIYSEKYPTQCMTHTGYTTGNRFRLHECGNPPTSLESFYIEPNYLDLVQELQGLRDLRISNMVYSTLMSMCPVTKH